MKTLHVIGLYIFVAIIILSIMMMLDSTHWTGLNKKNDKTFFQKFINRLYFLTTTFSTTGYGDLAPNTLITKILTMILQIMIIIGFVEVIADIVEMKVVSKFE